MLRACPGGLQPLHRRLFSSKVQGPTITSLAPRLFKANAGRVFDVVSNVDDYHSFVPFIEASEVLRADKKLVGVAGSRVKGHPESTLEPLVDGEASRSFKKEFQATLTVGFGLPRGPRLSDTYTSLVKCRRVEALDGGLLEYSVLAQDLRDSSHFVGLGSLWVIRPRSVEASVVEFSAWYQLKSSNDLKDVGVEMIVNTSMPSVSSMQMVAFEKKAVG